jgi:hypothetical protein
MLTMTTFDSSAGEDDPGLHRPIGALGAAPAAASSFIDSFRVPHPDVQQGRTSRDNRYPSDRFPVVRASSVRRVLPGRRRPALT